MVSAFNQSVYLLFYLSAGLVSLLLIFVIFVLPESLENAPLRPQPTDSVSRFRRHIRNLGSSLVAPITIFMPKPPLEERYGKRDYNVTFVGAALFIYLISIVSSVILQSVHPLTMPLGSLSDQILVRYARLSVVCHRGKQFDA